MTDVGAGATVTADRLALLRCLGGEVASGDLLTPRLGFDLWRHR